MTYCYTRETLRGIINMDPLWNHVHMFHPPPPSLPPLPPGDEQLNSPFFLKNIASWEFPSIYIHYQPPQGNWLPVLFLTTAHQQYGLMYILHVQATLINNGNTDWQTRTENKTEPKKKKRLWLIEEVPNLLLEESLDVSLNISSCYASVKKLPVYEQHQGR